MPYVARPTDIHSGTKSEGLPGCVLTGKIVISKSNTKMRITSKGQVTIPQELRERFGLLPNTEVEFVATPDGKELRLMKSSKPSGRGRALAERMRGRRRAKGRA